jgi:Prp8 binding protein
MPELKRKLGRDETATALVAVNKKARNELVAKDAQGSAVVQAGAKRTSNMEAAIMQLTGCEGEIYAAKFHPDGNILASAGFDRQIYLWNVYGECENFHVMSGHRGSISELHFSTGGQYIYSASTDNTVGVFDVTTGSRIKRMKGHTTFVNSCHPARRGPPLVVSGSDDCSIKIWDQRKRGATASLNNTYQVTAVTFSDTAEQVVTGGIDNVVKVWDLRKNAVVQALAGHNDTITGIALSPDGSYALTNAMDNTLRIWDIRPFAATNDRCMKTLTGHSHNFEKNLLHCAWSPGGDMVAAASADRFVYIWDTATRRIIYKLPGHLGSVNDVDFHKLEPIILSASSDKSIYLGEFDG